jgi:hypothetical protein
LLTDFHGNEAFFLENIFKMADSKKQRFSKTPILKKNIAKISGIGPWVSRVDWGEKHWCGSTYMVVMHFCLFLSLWQTVSQPESHQCPLHQSIHLRIGGFENLSFFESAILDFIKQIFCFIPMKSSQHL